MIRQHRVGQSISSEEVRWPLTPWQVQFCWVANTSRTICKEGCKKKKCCIFICIISVDRIIITLYQQIDFLKIQMHGILVCTFVYLTVLKKNYSVSAKFLILTISLSISSETLWRDNSEFFKLYLLRKLPIPGNLYS